MHDALDFIPLRWLVFAHVASAMGVLLVHGGSAAAILRLRSERDAQRVKALLDMSGATVGPMWIAMGALAITGLVLMLVEHAWRQTWAWGSIVVLVALSLSMSFLATQPFNRMRHAAGLRWFDGKRTQPATGVLDESALEAERAKLRVGLVLALGSAGYALLLWLMIFRPT